MASKDRKFWTPKRKRAVKATGTAGGSGAVTYWLFSRYVFKAVPGTYVDKTETLQVPGDVPGSNQENPAIKNVFKWAADTIRAQYPEAVFKEATWTGGGEVTVKFTHLVTEE